MQRATGVVMQMRIGAADSIDFGVLARRETLICIEAPCAFEQALSAQDLVNSRNAAGEIVRRIKNRSVAVGYLRRQCEERSGNRFAATQAFAFGQQIDGFACPASPLAEQTAGNAQTRLTTVGWHREFSQQINDYVVICAGV